MQEILVNLENDYPSKTPLHSNTGRVCWMPFFHFFFLLQIPLAVPYGTNISSTYLYQSACESSE